jgi:hypothetical protein
MLQEALALGAEITDLVAKKEKKEKSKGKKKNEHLEKYKDLVGLVILPPCSIDVK